MKHQFKPLETQSKHKHSVLLFASTHSLFKVGELMEDIKVSFKNAGMQELHKILKYRGGVPQLKSWFGKGIECEILNPNQTWQKGKVRIAIALEFCPDDSEERSTDTHIGK